MSEFELVSHIRSRVVRDETVAVGIGDDAAVLRPAADSDLVATTDNLVEGRHFDTDCTPRELGHLALAVNLSDLAAMGARPRWLLLTLTLPEADRDWVDAFLDGFLALAGTTGCNLVGGNLARGPLNISVTALGEVARGQARRRSGARPGDRLVVTGSLGGAAAALELGADAPDALRTRLVRPEARIAAGRRLAPVARVMIDISDGLVSDLAHLLSLETGAEIRCADLPAAPALVEAIAEDSRRWRLQLTGGGDYELLAALPPEADLAALAAAIPEGLTEIGCINDTGGIGCLDGDGQPFEPGGSGWDHFRGR